MRILLVADLHYTLPQFDWVIRVAPEFDLVVIAGDLLDVASAVALPAQVAVMQEYLGLLARAGRVVVSSGNHDLTGPDHNGEQRALWLSAARDLGVPTDGDSVVQGDTLVTVCPWWDGPLGRDEVEAQLTRDASNRPRRWVWVYHWPPSDSPTSWTGKRSYGDRDLAGWIATFAPDVVLSGHVHQPPFLAAGNWADRIGSTWVFNPGKQIGPVPAHVEIDLAAGEASWASMLGREHVRLDAGSPPERTVF